MQHITHNLEDFIVYNPWEGSLLPVLPTNTFSLPTHHILTLGQVTLMSLFDIFRCAVSSIVLSLHL